MLGAHSEPAIPKQVVADGVKLIMIESRSLQEVFGLKAEAVYELLSALLGQSSQ